MRYRNIHCVIWNDDKFPFVSDDCQLVFFHLMTTPLSTPFGLFKASLSALAAEKRWSEERYTKGYREGYAKGFLKYDEKHLLMYLPKFLKYNPPDNPNVLTSWFWIYNELPDSPLKDEFNQALKELVEGYGKGFRERYTKLFGKGIGNGIGNGIRKNTASSYISISTKEESVRETKTPIITPERFKEWFNILKTIPEYPFNEKLDFEFLSEKEKDFPKIDITSLLKAWKIYIGDAPFKKNARHRSQLHNQFELAVKYNKHLRADIGHMDDYETNNAFDKIKKDRIEFERSQSE